MIYLYSGTPGSGKSLHCASNIYNNLKYGNYTYICNFPINMDKFTDKQRKRFIYRDNAGMTPEYFQQFSEQYFREHPAKSIKDAEGRLKIYIDEAQIMFNAREWQKTYSDGWTKFFSLHRHLGYDIILIAQFDRMLDRQIRSLIEYEYVHRKISNMGIYGKVTNIVACGGLFYCAKIWYPQKEKIGGDFFKYRRKYDGLYDTHAMFTEDGVTASVTGAGGMGTPEPGAETDIPPMAPLLDNGNT